MFHLFFKLLSNAKTKNMIFFKFLWPSQNIWTLCIKTQFWKIERREVVFFCRLLLCILSKLVAKKAIANFPILKASPNYYIDSNTFFQSYVFICLLWILCLLYFLRKIKCKTQFVQSSRTLASWWGLTSSYLYKIISKYLKSNELDFVPMVSRVGLAISEDTK